MEWPTEHTDAAGASEKEKQKKINIYSEHITEKSPSVLKTFHTQVTKKKKLKQQQVVEKRRNGEEQVNGGNCKNNVLHLALHS